MKKYLAVIVILLFIGLAVAPSINANVSKEHLVEFTTEVCGLNCGKQTVKLTQEEAEEVEALFDSIRERLNATESRDKAEEIFKEAVVELDKYGLLGGLSIEQAQKLVTGGYQDSRIAHFMENLSDNIQADDDVNFFCQIVGNADDGIYFHKFRLIFHVQIIFLMYFLTELARSFGLTEYSVLLLFLPYLWAYDVYSQTIYPYRPICITNVIDFNDIWGVKGELLSKGLLGEKEWNGTLWGKLSFGQIIYSIMGGGQRSAIFGFNGIRIPIIDWLTFRTKGYHYLGHALMVKVSSEKKEI